MTPEEIRDQRKAEILVEYEDKKKAFEEEYERRKKELKKLLGVRFQELLNNIIEFMRIFERKK